MDALHYWLFGACFSLNVASFVWQWAHRNDCEVKRIADAARLATLDTEMADARAEILRTRENIHRLKNDVSPAVVDYQMRQRKDSA